MLGVIGQRQTVAAQACSLSLQEPDCLAWSDDNRIALVTPPAILIYDVGSSVTDCSRCLPMESHTFPAPGKLNPHFRSGVEVSSLSYGAPPPPPSLRQLLLPLQLSAPLSCVARGEVARSHASSSAPPGCDVHHGGCKIARWSSSGAAGRHRCALAMLTSDHQLLLACGRSRRFRPSLNLTPRWEQWLKNNDWPLSAVTEGQPDGGGSGGRGEDESDCDNTNDPNDEGALNNNDGAMPTVKGGIGLEDSSGKTLKSSGFKRSSDGVDVDEDFEPSSSNSPVKKKPRVAYTQSIHSQKEEIKLHTKRLLQLAIKDVCWSPFATPLDGGSRWQSELLLVTHSGHAVVWTVTAREKHLLYQQHSWQKREGGFREGKGEETSVKAEPCSDRGKSEKGPSPKKRSACQARSSDGNIDPESDGTGDIDAIISCSFPLQLSDATCLKWIQASSGHEVLLVGTAEGLLKVYSVLRVAKGHLQDIALETTLFQPDGLSVTNVSVIEYSPTDPPRRTDNTTSVSQPPGSVAPLFTVDPLYPTDNRLTAPPSASYEEACSPCTVLLAAVRHTAVSVACLRLLAPRGCCQLATAEALCCRLPLTGLEYADRDHIYCSTREGTLLCLSVLVQPPPLLPGDAPHPTIIDDKPRRSRTNKSIHKDKDAISAHDIKFSQSIQDGSCKKISARSTSCSEHRTSSAASRTSDNYTVNIEGVVRSSDKVEYIEDVPKSPGGAGVGATSSLRVLCSVYSGSGLALSLRRRIVQEFTTEGSSFLSLTSSPNKAFYAIMESLRVPYDHLVMRECSQMCVYLASGIDSLQHHLHECGQRRPLHQQEDILTAIRLLAVRGKHLDLSPLLSAAQLDKSEENCVPNTILGDGAALLLLWLSKLYVSLSAGGSLQLPPPPSTWKSWVSLQEALWSRAQQAWLRHVVQHLYENKMWTEADVSAPRKMAVSLMCDHFVERGPSTHSQWAMEVLLRLNGGCREQCGMGRCQLMVSIGSLTEARCADGHVLPRCCRSLLSVRPVLGCQLCDTVMHPTAAAELCSGVALCLVCRGVAEPFIVGVDEAEQIARGYALLPRCARPVHSYRTRKTKNSGSAKRI